MKNITLSADEKLIAAARLRASSEGTTSNAKFREWPENYVSSQQKLERANCAINVLQAKYSTANKKYTREEMNKRN